MTRYVTRQAIHYTKYDGKTRLNGSDSAPTVLVRGKSYDCTFIVTDDNVLHIALHEAGIEHVREHQWGGKLVQQEPSDMYLNYHIRIGFEWYQIPHVNTTNLPFLVLKCKELAHLNIKGVPRKPRKGDPGE